MDDCSRPLKNQHSKNDIERPLAGWSKDEKFTLLQCIKTFGSWDIEDIHANIPDKSPEQIKSAIDHYKSIAFKDRNPNNIKKGGRPKVACDLKPSMPLSYWAQLLTDNISYEDLQTEVATALRLIAEFESIPQALCTEYVDFRKAYHMLANAVEGKDLQEDQFLTMLITKSIVETALTSKVFLQNTTVKQIVDNIVIKTEQDMKDFHKPVTNKELGIIQYLADQRNYNPLNISEQYLKADREF